MNCRHFLPSPRSPTNSLLAIWPPNREICPCKTHTSLPPSRSRSRPPRHPSFHICMIAIKWTPQTHVRPSLIISQSMRRRACALTAVFLYSPVPPSFLVMQMATARTQSWFPVSHYICHLRFAVQQGAVGAFAIFYCYSRVALALSCVNFKTQSDQQSVSVLRSA